MPGDRHGVVLYKRPRPSVQQEEQAIREHRENVAGPGSLAGQKYVHTNIRLTEPTLYDSNALPFNDHPLCYVLSMLLK